MTNVDNYHFIDDIYDFFNCPEKPVDWSEFREFWLSLTPEEVFEFRTTPLSIEKRALCTSTSQTRPTPTS